MTKTVKKENRPYTVGALVPWGGLCGREDSGNFCADCGLRLEDPKDKVCKGCKNTE